MKNKVHIITIILFCLSFNFDGYSQEPTKGQDSMVKFIDSLVRDLNSNRNTKVIFDHDESLFDKEFAFDTFDSTTNTLIEAAVYTYTKKVKKVTNMFFYNHKLIKAYEYRVPIRDQMNKKYSKLNRFYYYWNDNLIYSLNTTNEPFDYKIDLETSKEVLRRFDKLKK